MRTMRIKLIIPLIISSIIMTSAIYSLSNFVGSRIIDLKEDYITQTIENLTEEQENILHMITEEDKREIAVKYIGSLIRALMDFEFFPRSSDFYNVADIVRFKQDNLYIDDFKFEGRYLKISCYSNEFSIIEEYALNLSQDPNYKNVTISFKGYDNGKIYTDIVCEAY